MSHLEKGSASQKEPASEKFLREFNGKPQDFYSHLGVERQEGKLDNGLTVVLFKKAGAKTGLFLTTLGGGRYDEGDLAGRAHFNEHIILAGTRQYPRKDLLVRPIENEGGEIGAVTSNEYMGIHVSLNSSSDVPLALDTLKQCVKESLYDHDTVENERGSVFQEMSRKKSNPDAQLYEEYQKAFFAKTPLAIPVLGTEETVKNMTKEDLANHTKEMFVGNRSALLVAGNLEMDDLMEMADKTVGALSKGRKMRSIGKLPDNKNNMAF